MAKYNMTKFNTAKFDGDILWLFYRDINDIIANTERTYINYTDLNRIETRMEELSNQLNNYKYFNNIQTKTDWDKQTNTNSSTNIPIKNELTIIVNNLKTLVNYYYVYDTTPNCIDSFENLDIYKANDIEEILYDLQDVINNAKKQFKFCGTIFCGGVTV